MTEAVFYDGETARRRAVSVSVTASSLDLHEGDEWIASWPVGAVRQREAADGVLRLALDGGPPLAGLDISDPETQTAIRANCTCLDQDEKRERTGHIVLWSALAVLSLALSVIFLLPLVAERLTPLVPLSLERRLGNAMDNQVKLVFGKKVCSAPAGTMALNKLSERLRKAAGSDVLFDIAVLDSKIPNAIALPGGRIYLFKGLLDRSEDADEIAGVLAHEIGHVTSRHGMQALIRAGGTSYLLGLLFGDVTGGAAIVVAARVLLDTAHSREAEESADAFSARTMLALGRSPAPLGLLLKRIEGNQSQAPAFPSTHPVTDQRLKFLERQAPARSGAPLFSDEEWRALKEICKTT